MKHTDMRRNSILLLYVTSQHQIVLKLNIVISICGFEWTTSLKNQTSLTRPRFDYFKPFLYKLSTMSRTQRSTQPDVAFTPEEMFEDVCNLN